MAIARYVVHDALAAAESRAAAACSQAFAYGKAAQPGGSASRCQTGSPRTRPTAWRRTSLRCRVGRPGDQPSCHTPLVTRESSSGVELLISTRNTVDIGALPRSLAAANPVRDRISTTCEGSDRPCPCRTCASGEAEGADAGRRQMARSDRQEDRRTSRRPHPRNRPRTALAALVIATSVESRYRAVCRSKSALLSPR